ncbi:hypothetical protein [uncultured Shewanella sp.]|uniref:hypothetical protein n=1 Tax=uncultured Shewanella sp. TaxID=173975 RepID=UPI002616B477|nr:hypothetical protein [uncultured Shewanella sp.]
MFNFLETSEAPILWFLFTIAAFVSVGLLIVKVIDLNKKVTDFTRNVHANSQPTNQFEMAINTVRQMTELQHLTKEMIMGQQRYQSPQPQPTAYQQYAHANQIHESQPNYQYQTKFNYQYPKDPTPTNPKVMTKP